MFMIDYKQIIWWYWLVLACLLTAGVSGYEAGFILAIGVAILQLIHVVISEHSTTTFPVQVRFWFLIYVLVAFPEPMQIIYWLPVVGTWARSIFGYCILARTVSLLPWNRHVPFSTDLLVRTFFSRPVRGCILQGLPPIKEMKETAGYA